jgi:gas vesicle protein
MKTLNLLFGFMIGAILGWVVGTLLAPAPGSELQSQIRSRIDAIIEEGRRAAEQRRAELEAQFMASKRPASQA